MTGIQNKTDRTKLEMKNKVVLITGASSGIGKALAEQMSRSGGRIYELARSLPDYFSDPAQECVTEQQGCRRPVCLDVTDAEAVKTVIEKIIQTENRIDLFVQAAGYGLAGAVEDTSPDEAQAQMMTNFLGSVFPLAPVLAQMRRQHAGLVVQIGSVAGFLPIPFQAFYSASKAAIAALFQAMANEVRPYGIRCLIVQPGDTKTGFTQSRIMSRLSAQSVYTNRCGRSIEKMADDEQNGMAPERIARLIIRQINKRRPPLFYTPGLTFKAAAFARRFLPMKFINCILYRMYAQ
ncbi:MAG: SDR family NAD(P)-dependent oxidoreductase [Clostridiaceae bacterium]|nr:SDR family NAD(P)-dependent oxidoreductase [Clostridiaceae bacterium]